MPTLADIRGRFPDYNDLDDNALAHKLHTKFYTDISFDDFANRIELQQPESIPDFQVPEFGQTIADPSAPPPGGFAPTTETKPASSFKEYWGELINATARGIARVGSAFETAGAGLVESHARLSQIPQDIKTLEKSRGTAKMLWEISKHPKLAATKENLGGKAINLIGETIPYITATTAGYLLGGPLGAFPVAAIVEGHGSYQEAVDAGVDPEKAKNIGVSVGIVSGAIESVGGKGAEVLFTKVVSGLKNKIARRAALFGVGTIVEALEEGGQEVAAITGEKTYREVDWEETVGRTLGAMAGGAFLGGVIKGGGVGIRTLLSQAAVKQPSEAPPVRPVAPETAKVAPAAVKVPPKPVAAVTEGKVAAKLPTTEPTVIEPTPIPAQKTEFIGEQPKPNVAKEVQQNMPQKAKVAPIKLTAESKDTSTLLDTFFAERDVKETAVDITTQQHQTELKQVSGVKKAGAVTQKWDEAIQVYIDLRDNPNQLKYYEKLTSQQKAIVDTAQNLPPNIKAFADKIIAENREFGRVAVDEEIIRNFKENYTARLWEPEPKMRKIGLLKKFGTTTARAKGRTLEGILHGWSLGKTLRIKGATSAQNIAHKQVTQAIVDKQVMKMAKDWGLISPQQHEGWIQVEHPNFTNWKFAGQVVAGKVYGRNFFKTKDGMLLERVPMYAEPELAKKLNTALSSSKLRGIGFIDFVSKWNSIIKQNILMTSFFHHQAYLRSYMAGGKTGLKNIEPITAYKRGGEAIRNFTPEVQQLVRGGLTIGKIQDWDEADLQRENTVFSRVARHFKAGEKGLAIVEKIRKQQTDFLFKKMGPQLKVQAALLEYRHQLKKHNAKLESGEISQHDIAKRVANLINDDFGGLNLRRIGRDPTAQHLFRLITLAPDWTESNVRSMVKAFRLGDEGAMYRAFWGRIALKMGIATAVFNFLMAAFDDDDFVERYQKAWKEGKLRWLDIDVTPIYKGLGGQSDKRKYFSLIGHFRDPIKFIVNPVRSAKHKSSVLSRIIMDTATGQDWAGRDFTSFNELIGFGKKRKSYEKRSQKYKGRLTKFTVGGAKFLTPKQVPSFLLYELRSAQPIQVQNALAFLSGEMDAFDALTKSAGLMTATTHPKKK